MEKSKRRICYRVSYHLRYHLSYHLRYRVSYHVSYLIYTLYMSRFISLRYDIHHTLCSLCCIDCFQKTFYLKECGHAYCMKCVSVYFDGLSKNITSECSSECSSECTVCINRFPTDVASKEVPRRTLPHELRQGHTEEVSLLR